MLDGIRPIKPATQSAPAAPNGALPNDYGITFHKIQSLDLLNKLLFAVMNKDGTAIKEIYDSYQNEMSFVMYLLAVPPDIKEAKYYAALCKPAVDEQHLNEMAESGYAPIMRFIKLAQTGNDLPIDDPQHFLNILNVLTYQKSLRYIGELAEQLGANQEYVDGFRAMLPKNAVRKLTFGQTDDQVKARQNDVEVLLGKQKQEAVRKKLTFDLSEK